jgi:hypothetical protein
MKTVAALLMLTISSWSVRAESQEGAPAKPPDKSAFQTPPEMRRLLETFVGEWNVSENFEVSATKQGRTRQGSCDIKAGPGVSMLEDCRTNGSAGELQFLAVLWWDANADAYQFFSCANASGCAMRGTARWEGNRLVNRWEEEDKGKRVAFQDSFVDFSPTSFTLISEGISDKVPLWRVVTRYVRRIGEGPTQQQRLRR